MAQPGGTANVSVRLPTARERDPEETGRLYLYLDESTIEAGERKMFGVGALLTPVPVAPETVERALRALRDDPDRNPASPGYDCRRAVPDECTLACGYFHASEDSANAHSHFARAIVEDVTGSFAFSFAELKTGDDGAAYRQHAVRSLYALLHTRKRVACVFERRPGLRLANVLALLEEMEANLDPCAFDGALMRSYYPHVIAAVDTKSNPGLQVADMLLWSIGQELFSPRKAVWAVRCGLFTWANATIAEAGMRWVRCAVNNRKPLFADEPDYVVPYPVTFDELTADGSDLMVASCYAMAERVLRRVAARPLPPHAEHLRAMVTDAVRMLDEKPEQVGPEAIRRAAKAFIRLFDTVPLYNGIVRDRPHPQWLPLLRAKRFLAVPLRPNAQGQFAAEFLAQARRDTVGQEPEAYGLPFPTQR
jgi:hypothetical protein